MTAAATVRGKRPDGDPLRFGLETGPGIRFLHVLATRTGELAHCGYRPKDIISPGTQSRAVAIEERTDPASRGFNACGECFRALTPQPDPAIWGPDRPGQQ